MPGTLYLVATPIGNQADLTHRAARILGEVDVIVCEEFKESDKLLRTLDKDADLFRLNEHNEEQDADRVVAFLQKGEDVALISDCGTPVLADPGLRLVQKAINADITIVPIPGPASPVAALVVAGFPLHKWYFRGFFSPKSEIRRHELSELKGEELTTIVMETPYRLRQLLDDMLEVLGSEREIALCWQLTTDEEEIIRGTIANVLELIDVREWKKGEFVVIIKGIEKIE